MYNKYVYILAAIVFIIPLIIAYFRKFDKRDLFENFDGGTKTLLKLIAFAIGYDIIKTSNVVERGISVIIAQFKIYIISPAMTAYIILVILFLVITFVIYMILRTILVIINKLLMKPLIGSIDSRRSGKASGTIGVIISLPKALAYGLVILLIAAIVPLSGSGSISGDFKTIATNAEHLINGSSPTLDFTASSETDNGNVIVYYNGVKLSKAVKSDAAINNMAEEITAGDTTDLQKAKSIYTWVGNNITYSDQKADEISETGGKGINSGAIPAFNTREGVCFDYASLYVAMAKAVGLKVRMVSGEGYTGTEWGPHAWNEVYIPSEGTWIPVDPTFESSGDFFNTPNFYDTHRDAKVIGQW